MKKSIKLTLCALCILSTFSLNAQVKVQNVKYRRSSLAKILVKEDAFLKMDTVLNAYNNAPFPEKYNNHMIDISSFNSKEYALTDSEKKELDIKNNVAGKIGKSIISGNELDLDETRIVEIPHVIDKFFKDKKIANQLVAKWFNRKEDGSFDMNLIGERGFYDATEMEAEIAKSSTRGTSSLADAGEELIKNTFVVVDKMDFISNEVTALAIRATAHEAADKINSVIAQVAAKKAADIAFNKMKDGYSVWTTSFLYQLKWNDSIANVFYKDLWFDQAKIDEAKKKAFDESDLFELEFVGSEKAKSLVLFTRDKERKKNNKPDKTTDEQIIQLATVRNVDNVYSKLQKEYDVFKTKIPIYSTEPLMAKIGMKEGLEGGERFEVLEQTLDPDTGMTEYLRKGLIKVDKKSVWDNRYNATDETESSEVEGTVFTGGGNDLYTGILIRQIK